MANFDYSQLHYFDSKGRELPLIYNSPKVIFENKRYENEYGEYLVVSKTPDSCDNIYDYINNTALHKTKTGKRFLPNDVINCKFVSESQVIDGSIDNTRCTLTEYSSNFVSKNNDTMEDMKECYIDDICHNFLWENLHNNGFDYSKVTFPSLYFSSKMYFKKVSTGLVESEAIYILAENPSYKTSKGANKYTTVSDLLAGNDTDGFLQRYQLMFFIDCREQSNFRFFTTNNSEIVWSDRKFIDFSADNNYAIGDTTSGFRVDIGFTGDLEGVYEENMYIFLIDKSAERPLDNYPGDAYLVGEIKMYAETEGEDERYRTFCDNFGIPDPKETYDAFADTDINQDSIDYIKVNDYSKKMFLAYDQIFPYVGTYKALINALNVLGYNDILFREWYKETGKTSNSGLVSYDIAINNPSIQSYKNNKSTLRTISSVPLEERIHLKKLNWISMVYKMMEETSLPLDRFGFPSTKKLDNYYNNGTLIKLLSLRKYLEKYILGINCRITDIQGEGIVFERYNTYKYGSYQQNFEYSNEKSVSLNLTDHQGVLYDGCAEIQAEIITSNSNISFSDMKNESFIDFCDGYISCDTNRYTNGTENMEIDSPNLIYCGKTIELNDTNSKYEIRSLGKCPSFRFEREKFVTSDSPSLIIDEKSIMFDPKDLLSKHRNTAFLNNILPIIQIKKGHFKKYNDDNTLSYHYTIEKDNDNINNLYKIVCCCDGTTSTTYLKDYPTLIPPTFVSDTHKRETITKDENGNDISIKSKQLKRTIKYKFNNTTKSYIVGSLKKWENVDVDTDFYYPNETYGLRYSTDNPFNIPCFKIQGYALSEKLLNNNNTESDAIIPIFNEYCMEILDGKMIFDDTENNRKIILNFSQNSNGKVDVNVSTIECTNIDGTYTYQYSKRIDETTKIDNYKTLDTKGNYECFINRYKSYDYENAINFNSNISLKFHNTGEYKITTLMYDQCNNVFCSPVTKKINIITPNLNTVTYTLSTEDKSICANWLNEDKHYSVNPADDNNICVYSYAPKKALEKNMVMIHHKSFDGDVTNPFYHLIGTYSSDNTSAGLIHTDNTPMGAFAQISNTLDKFIVIDKSVTKVEKYYKIALKVKNVTKYSNKSFYPATKEKLLNDITEYNINHLNNAVLTVYNSASEYPVALIQGLFSSNNDYFVFKANDTSIIDDISACTSEIYILPNWLLPANIEYTNDINIISSENLIGQDIINNDLYKLTYKFDGKYGSCIVLKDGVYNDGKLKLAKNVTNYTPDTSTYSFYISHIDDTFTSYIMKLDGNKSTTDLITGDNSRETKKISQHIDKGFTASVREFDITIGQKWYNNGINIFEQKKNDLWYGHNGQTKTDGIVILKTGIASNYYCGTDGIGDWDDIIETTLNEEFTKEQLKTDQTFRWRIYKQNKHNSSRKLMIECYNKYPIFYIDEKGIYDIEATMFDKYGNKHERKSAASITVI